MTISNEAIEAEANAISECAGMRFDGFWSRVEDLEPEDREYALLEARAALDSAAPIIRAEALEAAAEAIDQDPYDDLDPFYAGWLRARAWNVRERAHE